ncbi:MAG: YraN family protein, partial [Gammaproteobacteria bacterium RIFCSPHIGHO2_12_FULL_45_9]
MTQTKAAKHSAAVSFKTVQKAQGDLGEVNAITFLESQGLRLWVRNYRTKMGEIDLICWDQSVLVFVEVRYRTSPVYGHPLETVTATKQQRLRRTAQHFLQKHRLHVFTR